MEYCMRDLLKYENGLLCEKVIFKQRIDDQMMVCVYVCDFCTWPEAEPDRHWYTHLSLQKTFSCWLTLFSIRFGYDWRKSTNNRNLTKFISSFHTHRMSRAGCQLHKHQISRILLFYYNLPSLTRSFHFMVQNGCSSVSPSRRRREGKRRVSL